MEHIFQKTDYEADKQQTSTSSYDNDKLQREIQSRIACDYYYIEFTL
jgi:hypothetical protein